MAHEVELEACAPLSPSERAGREGNLVRSQIRPGGLCETDRSPQSLLETANGE